jgi:hypothetical protein
MNKPKPIKLFYYMGGQDSYELPEPKESPRYDFWSLVFSELIMPVLLWAVALWTVVFWAVVLWVSVGMLICGWKP